MNNTISRKRFITESNDLKINSIIVSNLLHANIDETYIIKEVKTNDIELKNFLLTLGCYEGELITLISALGENYIINIKDSRYSIDKELAATIIV